MLGLLSGAGSKQGLDASEGKVVSESEKKGTEEQEYEWD